jgi:hypothetical protein
VREKLFLGFVCVACLIEWFWPIFVLFMLTFTLLPIISTAQQKKKKKAYFYLLLVPPQEKKATDGVVGEISRMKFKRSSG